jgi:hypothetical protein
MRSRRALESIHLVALGLWLGVLVMSGVTAAVIFPTVHALNPTLPAYAAYTGPHWSLAAGQVAARVFTIADAISLVCGLVGTGTLGLLLIYRALPGRSAATALRVLGISVAMVFLGYQLLILGPAMQREVAAYWSAAGAGDNATAATFKAAFDAHHPVARNVMALSALSVFVALLGGAWSAAAGPVPTSGGTLPT